MEVYVPVKGANGRYLVSNMGNMKCLSRSGNDYIPMTPMQDRRGYLRVDLHGVKRGALVHRLVVERFVPNPCAKETVNHKNESKTDNRADNLEWLTIAEIMITAQETLVSGKLSKNRFFAFVFLQARFYRDTHA